MLDDNQLDDKIKNICEELGKLATRKKELEESSLPLDIIERKNLLRKNRANRRQLENDLGSFSSEKAKRAHPTARENAGWDDEEEDLSDDEEEPDPQEEIDKDERVLEEDNKTDYNRLVHLCIRTKEVLKAKKAEVENSLKEDSALLTDIEKRERSIKTKATLLTIAENVKMYKEHCQKLINICSHGDVEQTYKNLNDVMDMANYITCLFEAHQEREKLIEKNSASGSLKYCILEKYSL